MSPSKRPAPPAWWRSIRVRITLLIAGVAVLTMALFAAAAYREVRQGALDVAAERMRSATEQIASGLVINARALGEEAGRLAAEPAILTFLLDPSEATRTEALAALERFESLGLPTTEIRSRDGVRLLATDTLLPAAAIVPEALLQAPPTGGMGPFLVDSSGVRPLTFYPAVAAVGPDEDPLGVVIRWRTLDTPAETRAIVQELIDPAAEVFLVNRDGGLWTDFGGPVPPIRVALDSLSPTDALAEGESADSGRVFAAGSPVPPAPWMVVVTLPTGAVLGGASDMLERLLLTGVLILIAGVLVGGLLGGRLTSGLEALAGAAVRISHGDYDARVRAEGSAEVGALAAAFNRMAAGVADAHHRLEESLLHLSAREAEAREVRERLEQVVSSSRAILFSCPAPGPGPGPGPLPPIRWISDNLRWILALEPGEALESGWWEGRVHPDDAPGAVARLTALHEEESVVLEYRFLRGDGHYRWLRDERRVRSDAGPGGREVVGVLTDITRQQELEAARAAAEGANRAKTEFLSRMSHELRTPLTAVLGFGQLLHDEARDDSTRQSVEQVLRAGRHLLGLIDEVLDITGIEAGRMQLAPAPVEVGRVVQEARELVRFLATDRGVELEVALDAGEEGAWVMADERRLRQVLVNLLSNGVKYNRPAGRVTVTLADAGEAGRVRLVVGDTGPGIAPELLPRLFIPFDRLGMAEQEPEGTGLGLAVSRALTQAMGGTLEVESRVGEGSRFTVELQRTVAPAHLEPRPSPESTATPPGDGVRGTVLLVEDHPVNRVLIEKILRRRPGVRLLSAQRGQEGVRLAREHRPGLVLLDLNLPDMGGDGVLEAIRTDPGLEHVRVVVISGDASPAQARRLLGLGAREYLFKPFGVEELLGTVDRLLAKG